MKSKPVHHRIEPSQLEILCPFHFFIDKDKTVSAISRRLQKLWPHLTCGEDVNEAFHLHRPPGVKSLGQILDFSNLLVHLSHSDLPDLIFRGHLLSDERGWLFVGTPRVTQVSELPNFGLTLSDFPLHDSAGDILMAMEASQTLLQQTQEMADRLTALNSKLDSIVEQRTAELQSKNRVVRGMLDNLRQGVLTLSLDDAANQVKINPEYSPFLERILERNHLSGKPFSETVFSQADLSKESIDNQELAIMHTLGESSILFELNRSHLVRECQIRSLHGGDRKRLEFDWSVIVNNDQQVTQVLVVIRDVTEVTSLRHAAQSHSEEIEIIGDILATNRQRLPDCLDVTFTVLENFEELLERNTKISHLPFEDMLRELHTLKGNLRVCGLDRLPKMIHLFEKDLHDLSLDGFSALAKGPTSPRQVGSTASEAPLEGREKLMWHIEEIEKICRKYQNILKRWFPSLEPSDTNADDLSSLVLSLSKELHATAREAGVAPPQVRVQGDRLTLSKSEAKVLENAFLHIFRNAIAHSFVPLHDGRRGAESANHNGEITVRCASKDNQSSATISVWDNGRGLHLPSIQQKAQELGISSQGESVSDLDLASLVFRFGLSTAHHISEIAGRGIGLNAVREDLEREGITIEIASQGQPTRSGYFPFQFVIQFPKNNQVFEL